MTEPERDLRVESWNFLESKQLDGDKAVAAPTPWKIAAIGFDSIRFEELREVFLLNWKKEMAKRNWMIV